MKIKCEICNKYFKRVGNRKYCFDCIPNIDNASISYLVTCKRRAIKRELVKYKGGKCIKCGYNKCDDALDFHHNISEDKDLKIAVSLVKKEMIKNNLENMNKELDKCVLLCKNCHREIHSNVGI